MPIQTWGEVLARSFEDLWFGVINYLPNVVISVVIFVVGWVVGVVVGTWVEKLVRTLKVDSFLQSLGVHEVMGRAGHKLNAGAFLGALVKWFFILAFLVAALDVLGLQQVNVFLAQIVAYLPNVIVAALILIIAAVVADFLRRLVIASTRAAGIAAAELFGGIVKWAVWVFALLAALTQLGIAAGLLQTLFTGIVIMIAIAGGLAFGLGGQDAAARFIERLRKDISRHE
jgi:small-conductance mechanosensitive channel